MKTCKRCKKELPLSEFYIHRIMRDGHLSFCKDCVRIRVSNHRLTKIEEIRAYDRGRGYRVYDPIKARARQLLYNAIRRGEIKKQLCWCGAKADGHHHDYSKPLDIEWLCKKHHGESHRKVA